MGYSPPGSSVPGILQARTLEWVAISFSNAWKWKVKVKSFSRVWPSATPWTAAYQAPPSMGFSRQEYWSEVPLPSPLLNHVQFFATLWAVALQALLSMGFPRKEYWDGFPFPSPGNLYNPGIKPASLASSALAGGSLIFEPPRKPQHVLYPSLSPCAGLTIFEYLPHFSPEVKNTTKSSVWWCHIIMYAITFRDTNDYSI